MTDTRIQAADMLLDIGIRIPVMPLRPFKKRPGKSFLVMRRPPAGAVIRIARRYLELGVTPEDIRAMDYEERMRFVAEKGKAVSRMVALAVCTGWLSGMLFSGPVAWYLRWRVHPAMLSAALIELLRGMDIQPFCNTIPLASRTAELLEPIGSRERKTGSRAGRKAPIAFSESSRRRWSGSAVQNGTSCGRSATPS